MEHREISESFMDLAKTLIPSVESLKFNEKVLQSGIAIFYRYEQNNHHFNSLIQEYGPSLLIITNGPITRTIEVNEVVSGSCEIIPIPGAENQDDREPVVIKCTVFDIRKIPVGSIFIDQDETAFIVHDVDPYCLTLISHKKEISYVYADVFFTLDREEIDDCYLILPPVIVETMIEQASDYKDKV